MPNKITLTFAGDADSLVKESKRGQQALGDVGAAADKSGKELQASVSWTDSLGTRMGHLGSAVSGASDALDTIGGSLQAVVDYQQAGAEKASRLARAFADVEQAQEDLQQAFRDGAQAQLDSNQAAIDLEQANIDAASAIRDYNDAVKEHGANSLEAQQAQVDLKQAQLDALQANEDAAQATRDGAQALIDAKTAQLDMNDAMRESHPPELQAWADQLGLITPIINSVVAVVGLVTAAQWAWNAAQLASPTTWIILAIVALVAIIVVIATKTTWFQDLWNAAWGWIKKTAVDVWDWLKTLPEKIGSAFQKISDFIYAPFRAAFNLVAKAWNNTIGKLSWSVPNWIPGIGGNTISAPKLPTFHRGGIVPGVPGQEVLAVLQAGEEVRTRGQQGGGAPVVIRAGGSGLDRLFLSWLLELLRDNNLSLVRQ